MKKKLLIIVAIFTFIGCATSPDTELSNEIELLKKENDSLIQLINQDIATDEISIISFTNHYENEENNTVAVATINSSMKLVDSISYSFVSELDFDSINLFDINLDTTIRFTKSIPFTGIIELPIQYKNDKNYGIQGIVFFSESFNSRKAPFQLKL